MNKLEKTINFIAREQNFVSVHTVIIFVTMWMTYEAWLWASLLVYNTDKSATDLAIIIAPVLTPITALQGFSFANYRWYREHEKNIR